jgi:magnesium transporter
VNGELHIGELAVFVGRNYVLSVRRESDRGFQEVRTRCEREPELLTQGSGFVLYALMDAVVDRYMPINDALEAELDTIEESMFIRGAQRSNIQRLYELKRKALRLRHAVSPLLETAGKLHGGRVPRQVLKSEEYFRDVYDHLQRINISIDAIRDTISTAIQVNLSMVAIDESEVNKRLAAWAAIFAVATAFAGIWGMNFEHMPELHWKYGYPAALTAMAGVCLYLYLRFRRAGWL